MDNKFEVDTSLAKPNPGTVTATHNSSHSNQPLAKPKQTNTFFKDILFGGFNLGQIIVGADYEFSDFIYAGLSIGFFHLIHELIRSPGEESMQELALVVLGPVALGALLYERNAYL
jgi:hypothetical protein